MNRRSGRRISKMRIKPFVQSTLLLSVASLLCMAPVFAQSSEETGKLKIHVNPKQAYVFVDGNAIRDGSETIQLSAGKHSVGVYNYGYTPETQMVDIIAGERISLNVDLQKSGDKVSGHFGDIE